MTLLFSLIFWKLLRSLLDHHMFFCAYCGQTSPNSWFCYLSHCFFLCGKGSFLRITWAYTSLNIFCDTCFRSVWRRFKFNCLFQHEKLSAISVLLLLGSSPFLYILVPRRQEACLICGTYNKAIFLSTVFQRLLVMLVWFSRILSPISTKYVHISSWHLSQILKEVPSWAVSEELQCHPSIFN